MKDVLQRIMYPLHSSSSKTDPRLHPWLFEKDLQLLELVKTSLLEWLHLWKRSLGLKKWSLTCHPGCSPAGFMHKGMGGATQIRQVQKNPPPKQSSPQTLWHCLSTISLFLTKQETTKFSLTYLQSGKLLVVSCIWNFQKNGVRTTYIIYVSQQNAGVEEKRLATTAPKPHN